MDKKIQRASVTDKGLALLAAVKSGLIPETDDGYDVATFEKFWANYVERSSQFFGQRLDQEQQTVRHLTKMLEDERQQRANDRADDRIAQRRILIAAFGGMIFGHFLAMLL